MGKGIDRKTAYKIMEDVWKGRGLANEYESLMKAAGVPGWYIDSCNKIAYLFPKAHAVAYTTMAFRIAWFKAHYPDAFYEVYMDVKDDLGVRSYSISETKQHIAEMIDKGKANGGVNSHKLNLLRVQLEMLKRC